MQHFTRFLEDVTVLEHETANFACRVSHEDAIVSWFVKGREVKKSDKKYIKEANGLERNLLINDAVKGDIGSVTATVRDEETAAKLHVIG